MVTKMNLNNLKYQSHSPAQKQQGVILVTSLIFLLILTIFGIVTLTTGTMQEKMAANSQLVTLTTNAAQSAVDAYVAEGNFIANNSIGANANLNVQIVRRTKDLTLAAVQPFVPVEANAFISCVNSVGTNLNLANCVGIDFLTKSVAANAVAAIRSRSKAYYVSCISTFCGPGMASSLGIGSTIGCMRFYVEGAGWIDLDNDGLPPAVGGEESPVFVSEWLRWQRPTLCN